MHDRNSIPLGHLLVADINVEEEEIC